MTTKTVKLARPRTDYPELEFRFTEGSCVVVSLLSGRSQPMGDVAGQFLIDELKGYGWEEVE